MAGDKRSGETFTFDLSTQSGVMQALLAVRTSPISAKERNELRDKLFLFAKTGDERLEEQLQQKLQTLPLSETFFANQKTEQPQEVPSSFTLGRMAPRFRVRQRSVAPADATTPASAPQSPVAAPSKAPVSADEPPPPPPEPQSATPEPVEVSKTPTDSVSTDQSEPAPVAPEAVRPDPDPDPDPEPVAASTPEVPATPAPVSEPASAPVPVAEEVVPETVSAAASAPTADTLSASSGEPTLERIREIKRIVNEAVGNPVNLVDKHNEIGRAYMSALLAAMQSVNAETGRAGTAEMAQLETVFQQVQTLLQTDVSTTNEVPVSPAVDITPTTTTQTAQSSVDPTIDTEDTLVRSPQIETEDPNATSSEKEQTDSAPPASSVTSADVATPPPAQPDHKEPPVPAGTEKQDTDSESSTITHDFTPHAITAPPVTASDKPVAQPNATVAKAATPDPVVSAETEHQTIPQESVSEQVIPVVEPTTQPSTTAAAASLATPAVTPPVARELDHTLQSQLTAMEEKAAALNEYHGDPLHAPEVERGLQQLLLEWSLFKTSGLFGTGPNGLAHPLFKKLAPLMVNDILLGKFEGSRPEIIQSITDYMNGWRYEQGIVYQPGETFETYLRRVIRFIIDSKTA